MHLLIAPANPANVTSVILHAANVNVALAAPLINPPPPLSTVTAPLATPKLSVPPLGALTPKVLSCRTLVEPEKLEKVSPALLTCSGATNESTEVPPALPICTTPAVATVGCGLYVAAIPAV